MHRESDKHGPMLDDELKSEMEGALRANRPTRTDEARETEPIAEDDELE